MEKGARFQFALEADDAVEVVRPGLAGVADVLRFVQRRERDHA
jgi:hypothetical protein